MLFNTISIGILHTHMFLESSLCENSHLHYNEKLDVFNYNGKHEKQDVFLSKNKKPVLSLFEVFMKINIHFML